MAIRVFVIIHKTFYTTPDRMEVSVMDDVIIMLILILPIIIYIKK